MTTCCLRTIPSPNVDPDCPENDPVWVSSGCQKLVEEIPGDFDSGDSICGGCKLPILYEVPEREGDEDFNVHGHVELTSVTDLTETWKDLKHKAPQE